MNCARNHSRFRMKLAINTIDQTVRSDMKPSPRKFIALMLTCAVTHSAVAADGKTDARACEVNFTVDGSLFSGKTYKTWQEFSSISYDVAFRKTAQAVAANSWGTVNANKDAGVITASQTVTMGKGSTAPLNVVVQEKKAGVLRIDVNYSTGPGQSASTDAARSELCKLAEAAGQ